ncbi:MAG: hypothetical protein AAF662_10165 [Pseudomonadota bacterium]
MPSCSERSFSNFETETNGRSELRTSTRLIFVAVSAVGMTFGAITFATHLAELRSFAKANALETVGEPALAYYDAPFTLPFTRRNETMFAFLR